MTALWLGKTAMAVGWRSVILASNRMSVVFVPELSTVVSRRSSCDLVSYDDVDAYLQRRSSLSTCWHTPGRNASYLHLCSIGACWLIVLFSTQPTSARGATRSASRALRICIVIFGRARVCEGLARTLRVEATLLYHGERLPVQRRLHLRPASLKVGSCQVPPDRARLFLSILRWSVRR